MHLEELYEHVVFIKQLLLEPKVDTFSIAMFFMNVNEGETSNIITFKRENESWLEPIENVQESVPQFEEILRNCFHVDTNDGEKFLLFTDEHMMVLNADDCAECNVPLNYKQTIDSKLTQCYICREDF